MKPVDLVFETYGNVNNCPLIILHGFLASSRNWRSIAKRLAEKYYVYLLDMRNHGASPHAEQMDYALMAYDVVCFMDNQGIKKAHLLGHSMGGKVAMWFALNYRARIESLMVADIAPVTYKHSFDPMIHALRQLPLEQLRNRKEAEQFLADAIPDMGIRQFLLQNLLLKGGSYYWRINLDFIHKNAHHIVGFPDSDGLPFLKEVLFIAGEESDYVKPAEVLKLFPEAEIIQIVDAGHWLYIEAPDAFCQVVEEWLSNFR